MGALATVGNKFLAVIAPAKPTPQHNVAVHETVERGGRYENDELDEFYKPERIFWEPPPGSDVEVQRAFGRSQQHSFLGRSAAWQRFTGRAR